MILKIKGMGVYGRLHCWATLKHSYIGSEIIGGPQFATFHNSCIGSGIIDGPRSAPDMTFVQTTKEKMDLYVI